jgi:hypothetical protein
MDLNGKRFIERGSTTKVSRSRNIDRIAIQKADVPDDLPLKEYFRREDKTVFPTGVLARLVTALMFEPYQTVGDLRRADDQHLLRLPNLGPTMLHCMRQRLGHADDDPTIWQAEPSLPLDVEVERLRGEVKALRDVIAALISSRPAASSDQAPPPPAAEPPALDDGKPPR